MNDEEIHIRLDTLLEQQQELLTLTRAIHTKLPLPDLQPQEEVWLTREKVMDYLCISERSFYRRRDSSNWQKRKSGGVWYYLKASLLQEDGEQ